MILKEGQTDYRIRAAVDYADGSQISQQELEDAISLEIEYVWDSFEGDATTKATWTATGYGIFTEGKRIGKPYIYYQATSNDIVPSGSSKLIGQSKIEDENGLISYGTTFSINVQPFI